MPTVFLTKPYYKTSEAARVLKVNYMTLYQFAQRKKGFDIVNGQRFIKAETVQIYFANYRPFDDCIIDFGFYENKPEVY
jgi:hypothetical protein